MSLRPPEAVQHRILVVEPERKRLRLLSRALRATMGTVDERPAFDEIPADGTYHLILANYDAIDAQMRRALLDSFGGQAAVTRLVFLSRGECEDNFADLFEGGRLTNLVALRDDQPPISDVLTTARKLLNGDIFGLEKYFMWGVTPARMEVRRSTEKTKTLQGLVEFAEYIDVGGRFINTFVSVADELITNAVYNAPTDSDGNRIFAARSRSEEVELPDGKVVEVYACCDGQRLGVAASDPFGSLTPEVLYRYLVRCFAADGAKPEDKAGGAGLGLFQVLLSLTHFVVNIEPGRRSEVIGILDISGSYRDFTGQPKSFNVFLTKSPTAPAQ